jgi:hypothetical protein
MSLVLIKLGKYLYGKESTTKRISISKSGSKEKLFKNYSTYNNMNIGSEEVPITPNKLFNNKLSQYYKISFPSAVSSLVPIHQKVAPHQRMPTINSIFFI